MAFFCIHCRSEIDPKFKACPFCGEPITDFLRRHLETPIDGKYQILARLGVGGMGEVYKVLHIHLNAIRVIKLMRANIAGNQEAHDRFVREARLATRIYHPNVAALFDFSTLDDGSLYMVWEYIEGINLHELIAERGPLSPRYAAKLAAQALMGLDAIHRAGIVHRDISPENLMITRDDEGEERVKVIDLGIAKQWGEEGDNKTKTGMFVGKWKYCSPEHLGFLGEGERIDGKADIYSFGIVLYEMLTGVPPFQAETPHGFLIKHSTEKPKPMREVNPSTSAPELERLIFRALEKDRQKRFATCREFAQAIEKLIPTLDDRPGSPPPLPRDAEVTVASTKQSAAIDGDAPTVVTLSQDAPTVATPVPGQAATDVLDSTAKTVFTTSRPPSLPPAEAPSKTSAKRLSVAAAIGLASALAIGAFLMRDKEVPPIEQTPVEARVVTPAVGRLTLNAFPWAEVTSIRDVDKGTTISLASPLVTPAPIELPPGKYELLFSNPQFQAPIALVVELKAGEEESVSVPFTDPTRAPLPNFLGRQR
jgi:serine/threonine-protein kinase